MDKKTFGTAIRLAIISMIVCGLLFPLLVTGLAQLLFPAQANGSLAKLNGRDVGSILIAQNFTSPMFFQPRNESASGVDPDITVQDAYSQVQTVSAATNITVTALMSLVNQNIQRTMWIAGDEYVNVLSLNILLIQRYPSIYEAYS
jgi:K+-transporting ATPase ATPase C chain